MICTEGNYEVRESDIRHKYSSAMAEYLDGLLDTGDDFAGGSDVGLYVRQFGKRLLLGNSQGSVWVERHNTLAEADKAMEIYHEEYDTVPCDGCHGDDLPLHTDMMCPICHEDNDDV